MKPISILGALAACLALSTFSYAAQGSQSLPPGFLTIEGNGSSSYPFNATADHKWQWHYDSSTFAATGPVLISQVYVRSTSLSANMSFDFPALEVVMASSPTDYQVLGHDPVFDNNLNPDATVVRVMAPWGGNNVPPLTWISLEMDQPFLYDPSLGHDFVLQLRKCGNNVTWGESIDGQSGMSGTVGGNRYGDLADCNATSQTFNNNEFVPVIRIDWALPGGPQMQVGTLVAGQSGSISITGVDSGGRVFLRSSLAGAGPIPTAFGDLELSPPVIRAAVVNADPSGEYVFSQTVPFGLFGRTLYFHTLAEVQGALTLSNPSEATVQ